MASKILVAAASLRGGSHNGRLAALVAKELTLGEARVTRISLADYPLPLLDADVIADSGPTDKRSSSSASLPHMKASSSPALNTPPR